jgi:hypothetical protein
MIDRMTRLLRALTTGIGAVLARMLDGRVLVLGLVGLATPALAQSQYCDRLRSELASVERAAAASGSPNAAALKKLQAELDRSISYARSIGCQNNQRRMVVFAEPPQAQCRQIESQINQMESNLAALEAEAGRNATGLIESRRAGLLAAIDANCRGGTTSQPKGLLELLFGGGSAQQPMLDSEMPDDPLPQDNGIGSGAGYRTICVRKCDGFFYPVSSTANRDRFGLDAELCRAACPGAETQLFVQPVGKEPDAAVSVDGSVPYSTLPNAFKYRKIYDQSCSCRRPGQSWTEALAEAEKILAVNGRSDALVTEQKAQELSRPKAPGSAPPAKGKPQANAAPPAPQPSAQPAASARPDPTASGTSVESVGPDGQKRSIRVVAPTGPAVR